MNLIMCSLFVIISILSGSESARRTVSTRNWDQNDGPEYEILTPKAVWMCNFDQNDCGIINDKNVGQYFKLRNGRIKQIVGKTNMILLNITEIDSYPSGARLITPYFQTKHHLKGCLTIEYLIRGNGVKNLLVYQQDNENQCIWNLMNDKNKEEEKWQKLSLTIELKNGDPRFFIESHFDNRPPNSGLMAISEIKFFYGACDRNEANYCDNHKNNESTDYPNDLP